MRHTHPNGDYPGQSHDHVRLQALAGPTTRTPPGSRMRGEAVATTTEERKATEFFEAVDALVDDENLREDVRIEASLREAEPELLREIELSPTFLSLVDGLVAVIEFGGDYRTRVNAVHVLKQAAGLADALRSHYEATVPIASELREAIVDLSMARGLEQSPEEILKCVDVVVDLAHRLAEQHS